MQTWIKAGLAGAALEILFTAPVVLFYVLPPAIGTLITCCLSILFFAVLPLVGVLTSIWIPKPTTNNTVIGHSALAGILSSAIDGIFTLALVVILHYTGMTMNYVENSMPFIDALPKDDLITLLSLPVQLISTSVCLVGNLAVAVLLSITGAVITLAIIQKKEHST